jgi:hypothetical protein
VAPTPHVWIEEARPGYTRYRRTTDGRRWEVHGTCDRRGDCLVGAVIGGVQVRDHAHLAQLARAAPGRVDSELDVPVTPEFRACCGADLFTYTELPPCRG